MLKRNKAVSIVMALCLSLAMLAPVFVSPKSAEASSTYEVVSAPTVKAASDNTTAQDLGVIKVTLPETTLFAGETLSVSLPSDIDVANTVVKTAYSGSTYATTSTQDGYITIVGSDNTDITDSDLLNANYFTATKVDSDNSFDITVNSSIPTANDKYFYIYFNGIKLNNYSGDVDVTMSAPGTSAFSDADDLVIAKTTTEGSTTTSIKKVNNIADPGGAIQPITIQEDTAGSFDTSKAPFKLEITTNGYSWAENPETDTYGTATYGWGLSGSNTLTSSEVSGDDSQYLEFTPSISMDTSSGTAGKVTISNLYISSDDSKANVGDEIQVKVSGYGITKTTLTVAKYSDYTATVEAGTTETLIAGQKDQDIGDFYIEEGAAGSLTEGRSITLTLPSGVEWVTDNENDTDSTPDNLGDYSVVNSSSITLTSPAKATGDNNEISKWTISDPSNNSTNGAKIEFKDMKVCVSPAFSGTLTLTVAGSAGVTGTVDVGTVAPAVTMAAANVANVSLGQADQQIGDVTITEGSDGALMEDHDLTLRLDDGYTWSDTPTVKVTNGDLDIDASGITTDGTDLIIPINGNSNTASTITLSDIKITADRTAPEGAISLQIAKNDSSMDTITSSEETAGKYDTATNEVPQYWDKSAGKVTIANCVTAAETSGSNVFTIGSNVYEANGAKKVMDVAPYIKSSRTYVPMRYLAEMVGADVAWDATAQTVTLTKGSTVVVFTIGSNAYTVNGASQSADVAPEIVNNRTFLPARFVAEAFGYQAGWDASTNTVVISD